MAGSKFSGLIDTVATFNSSVFRNIPTIIVSENLLDDLTDIPEERAYGEAIVSEQAYADDFFSPLITRPFTYGVPLCNSAYSRVPTRFSRGDRFGVWYGSLELLTTVYETLYHWKKRLADMLMRIEEEVVSERRMFRVTITGILIDLRGKQVDFPQLIDGEDYSFTHALGDYLYDNGQKGLLVHSARLTSGVNIAAFSPDILHNPRHHSYLIYKWVPGKPEITIERPRGKVWKRIAV